MKVRNVHERTIAAPAGQVAALIADFDRIWPTQIGPAPRPRGHCLFQAGMMTWEEYDRPGAARAFRVLEPGGLQQMEHWFDIESAAGATVLRHTVQGHVAGEYEAIWRERIEPGHDEVLEAILDNVEAAAGSGG
jgi:hypothetical protein